MIRDLKTLAENIHPRAKKKKRERDGKVGGEKLEFELQQLGDQHNPELLSGAKVKLFIIPNLARTRDRLAEIWCKQPQTTLGPLDKCTQSRSWSWKQRLFPCSSQSQR